uniref:Zinc knuckle CX2CX4HX4C n=1 Tax=Tanacetum cinerariifolium TaxID=118510 RepID=A0A6L2MEP3_TANCI|nr:zinc knuckle CX2CX4HX4C [Tanacetum cinerariifolium]
MGLRDNGGIKPASFASMFKDDTSKKMIHISELRNDKCVSGADVSIPLASVDADETTMAPVWVKLHNVPIVAFSKVRLSLITTKLGRPIMLDADTITMCPNSQRRNTYARALIEVSSTYDLVDSLIVVIPFQNGSGHSLETIDIEYEWIPPHCDTCKIFDQMDEHCPKKPKTTTPTLVTNDGFAEVTQKGKGKHASKSRHIDGVRLTKPKPNYFYRPVSKSANVHGEASTFHIRKQFTETLSWMLKSNNIESTVNDSASENVFLKDNGKPIDGLVDDAHKKVEAPPKKTPRKNGIWSGRKLDYPKRNVVFLLKRRFTTLIGRISRKWSMGMPIAKRVDDCCMVIDISCESIYFCSIGSVTFA